MKQKNKIRFLLVAVLAGVSVMGYAQGKWCTSATATPYQIVQVTAPSDEGAKFHWTKDGKEISGATSSYLTLPTDLTEGKYTYIRYATKPTCPDAVASNAFTVEVLTCGEPGSYTGAKGTFVDERDNKVYKVVRMPGGKVWMAENLNYQKDLKFNAQANQAKGVEFISKGSGVPGIGSFWCPQADGTGTVTTSPNPCNVYGALYTWETAMSKDGITPWVETGVEANYYGVTTPPSADIANINNAQDNGRGICPYGYHMPTEQEFAMMLDEIENVGYTAMTESATLSSTIGIKLKSSSTYVGTDPGNGAWLDHVNRGTDETGFGAQPAGRRSYGGMTFTYRGMYTDLMTSSTNSGNEFYRYQLKYTDPSVWRAPGPRSCPINVRCVKN
jgi:uncharacterized protein (TIGR02145 family)